MLAGPQEGCAHMTIAVDTSFSTVGTAEASPARSMSRLGTFAAPALASLGAGAVHAAAVGAHAGARQAVLLFAGTAVVQLGLGAVALVSYRKLVGVALGAANLALLGGWVLAKRSGLSFVDGMEDANPVEWADGLAAALAALTVVGVAVAIVRSWRVPASDALVRVLALPIAAITITGMVAVAGGHHAAADTTEVDHHAAADASDTGTPAAAVPPKPFVPGEPIDLGGVPGVTPGQQAAAENLLAATLYLLPQFADPAVATARGWNSIGDGATGYEHFVNPSTFNDGKILDPSAPESLVFETANGKKTLVAAMFMLPPGTTLADVPDVGGKLMQWHIHDNLCFSPDTGKVAGLRDPGAPCTNGLVGGGENPMIHVWIRSHECGPFSALEGIAGGTIAEGETRLCDTAHGH